MVFVIGLTIKAVKYGYKTYKKHQTEKDLRERGVPQIIPDPSDEITEGGYYNHTDNINHGHVTTTRSRSSSPRQLKQTLMAGNSSRASIDSVSTAEVEAQLENDADFQEYMRRQRQAYLNQRRTGQGFYDDRLRSGSGELPSSSPPAYEAIMAQERPANDSYPSSQRTSSRSMRQQVAELADEEIYIVSPITPVSARHESRAARELDGNVSLGPISPVGVVCELPAAPHASTSKYPVELPSMVV